MNKHVVQRYEQYLTKNINGYDIVQTLGAGMQGIVTLIRRKQTGELFCLKLFHWDTQRELRRLERELHLYGRIKHPNIIEAFSFSRDGDAQYMALRMGYCDSGSLQQAVQNNISMTQRALLFLQLLLGVEALHNQGIIHRDLKPDNLLLSSCLGDSPSSSQDSSSNIYKSKKVSRYLLKIADFGLSRVIGMEMKNFTPCGTPIYMAPEVLRGKAYNTKADVYSVGLVGFYLIKSEHAFRAKNIQELQKAQQNFIIDFTLGRFIHQWMKDVVRLMLAYNPEDRPTLLDILALPELREILNELFANLRVFTNEKSMVVLDAQQKRISSYQTQRQCYKLQEDQQQLQYSDKNCYTEELQAC